MKKLKVIQNFYGNPDEALKMAGDEYTAPNARADELEKMGLVEILTGVADSATDESNQTKHKK